MSLQSGKQKIAIHRFLCISRSESNQAMRLGQLIECDMKNIFLKISHTKCCGETIPRSFCKNSKLSISLDQ